MPSVGEQEAGDDQDRHELPVLDDEEPEEVVGDVAAQIETESEAQVIEGQELTIEAEASLVFGDAASDGEAELVDVAQDAAPLLRENTPAPQPEEVVDDSLVEDEGDYDMRLELPAAEDEPVEPEHVFTSFEEESAQEQPLEEEVPPQETFERSSAAPDVPPKILEESFSFARELSVEEEELEEESVDRELSVEPRHDDEDDPESRRSLNGRCNSSPLRFSNSAEPFPSFDDDIEYCAQNEATVEAEDDSSSGDESDFVQDSVVTISSNDPLVAARAAAILKQVRNIPFICAFFTYILSSTTTTCFQRLFSSIGAFCTSRPRRRRGKHAGGALPTPASVRPDLPLRRPSDARHWEG